MVVVAGSRLAKQSGVKILARDGDEDPKTCAQLARELSCGIPAFTGGNAVCSDAVRIGTPTAIPNIKKVIEYEIGQFTDNEDRGTATRSGHFTANARIVTPGALFTACLLTPS